MEEQCEVWPIETEFSVLSREVTPSWPEEVEEVLKTTSSKNTDQDEVEFVVFDVTDDAIIGSFIPKEVANLYQDFDGMQEEAMFSLISCRALVFLEDRVLVGIRGDLEPKFSGWAEFAPEFLVEKTSLFGEKVDLHHLAVEALYEKLGIDKEAILVSHPFALCFDKERQCYDLTIKVWLDETAPLSPLRVSDYKEFHWIEEKKLGEWLGRRWPQVHPCTQGILTLI